MTKDSTSFLRDMTSPLSTPDGSVLMNIPMVPVMDGMVGDDGIGMVSCGLKTEVDVVENPEEEEVDINQMLTAVSADGQLIRTNQSALQSLLSTTSLSQIINQQGPIQVVTLPTTQDLVSFQTDNVQLVPTKYFGLVAIPPGLAQAKLDCSGMQMIQTVDGTDLNMVGADNMATIIMPTSPDSPDPPPGCPAWAARLKKCEKIGDSYRGYVESEVNLDIILTLHKQQTNSFWGTRQSPSTAKTSTRLMWKSQYVPFDGIPFINSGSRAVVMECQYGPRRKGTGKKSHCPTDCNGGFRQTCPARIYVKKVRKFPTYAVNLNMEKKSVRVAMDKAFHELREKGANVWGEDRFYVQLPTEEAHDFHEEGPGMAMAKQEPSLVMEDLSVPEGVVTKSQSTNRIHPRVLEKIRQVVAGGETRLYAIRKQLRKFAVRELFRGSRQVPERHDLTVFPTVNDLKNHIHQALTDIETGALAGVAAHSASMDMDTSGGSSQDKEMDVKGDEGRSELPTLWSGTSAMPETVTVTLTQNPEEDGHHVISRIETHLSDGSTQVSTTLTPETAQLLARLQPSLFRTANVQLDGTQMASSPSLMADGSDSATSQAHSVQVIPDLEMAPLVEGAHGLTSFDSAHLAQIVDMDGHVQVSSMMDQSEATQAISNIVKMEPNSHPLSGIHLHSDLASVVTSDLDSDSAHLASVVTSDLDSDSANLASVVAHDLDSDATSLTSVVTSDPHHQLAALTSGHISMLNSVDQATISAMVSSGAAHLSCIISSADNSVDPITLVSAGPGGEGHISMSLSGEEGHFQEEEEEGHCVSGMIKSRGLGCEEEGHEPNLENEKIILHMTTDQELGMARLENKVSIL